MSPFIHIKSDHFKTKFIASLSQREVWRECKYGCPTGIKKERNLFLSFFCAQNRTRTYMP